MAVRFYKEDWERIRRSHEAWWNGELDRPLLHVQAKSDRPADRKEPANAPLSQANCLDFSITPEEIVERLDYDLSCTEFYADAFPMVNFNSFGPGVAAAFSGAEVSCNDGRIWFFPAEKRSIADVSIRYNPEHPLVKRIKAIYRAGGERWQGNVMMAMPDLGGVMDIVATFVGTEELLLALYDEPDEVKRVTREAHAAFMEAYRDLEGTLRDIGNPGYTDWDGLYSRSPSYVIQSDFSYMIGPDMFAEFVCPDLQQSCRELTNVIYHLDGIGQLPHLPQLLNMDNLRAIQWVPGDGQKQGAYWMEVYRKIVDSGRGCEIVGGPARFLEIHRELSKGLFHKAHFASPDEAKRFFEQCGMKQLIRR